VTSRSMSQGLHRSYCPQSKPTPGSAGCRRSRQVRPPVRPWNDSYGNSGIVVTGAEPEPPLPLDDPPPLDGASITGAGAGFSITGAGAGADSALGDFPQHLASHFVSAEFRHFPAGQAEVARRWIRNGAACYV
jgi:hypothetical protein